MIKYVEAHECNQYEAEKNFWVGYAYYLSKNLENNRKIASEYWKTDNCFNAIVSLGFDDNAIQERIKPKMLRAFAQQLYNEQQKEKEKGKQVLETCLSIESEKEKSEKEKTYLLLLQHEDFTTYFVKAALDDDLENKKFLMKEIDIRADEIDLTANKVLDALLVVYERKSDDLFEMFEKKSEFTKRLHVAAIKRKHDAMRKKLGRFYCDQENWDANQENWNKAREIWNSFTDEEERAKVIEEELGDKEELGEIYYRLSPGVNKVNIDKLHEEFMNFWKVDGGTPPQIPVKVEDFYLQKAIAHKYQDALYLQAMEKFWKCYDEENNLENAKATAKEMRHITNNDARINDFIEIWEKNW